MLGGPALLSTTQFVWRENDFSGQSMSAGPNDHINLPDNVPLIRRLKDLARSGMTACGLDCQRWAFGGGGQTVRIGFISTGTSLEFGWRRNSEIGTLVGLRSRGIRTVLDVGANDGGFAWLAMNALPDARIYSFEPLPSVYAELERRIRKRRAVRVEAYNLAIGDHEGDVPMFLHPEDTATSSLLPSSQASRDRSSIYRKTRTVRVRMDTLDGWVERSKIALEPEILLKLDVQGYERHVLNGAPQTLRLARACLLEVNFAHFYEGQPTFETLSDHLRRFDYSFAGVLQQDYTNGGRVAFADVLFIRESVS